MANIISDELIAYAASLAELELSEEEKKQAARDMGRMLDYMDQLNKLDTSEAEPMYHAFDIEGVFREDTVTGMDGRKEALANAPLRSETGFVVPKTIGSEGAE